MFLQTTSMLWEVSQIIGMDPFFNIIFDTTPTKYSPWFCMHSDEKICRTHLKTDSGQVEASLHSLSEFDVGTRSNSYWLVNLGSHPSS